MRQDVLQQVGRGLKATLSRRIGVSLALWGEAGIGKTHAAREVLRALPCEHLSVSASVPTSQIPDLPRPRQFPEWAVGLIDRLRAGQELGERAQVDTLITSLAALSPFVLHIEDFHEADPARQRLIVALARAVKRTPGLGLLLTSRGEPPEPFVRHHLTRLETEETAALLAGHLGTALPGSSVEWIQARTGGNPLYALEFLRYLTRQGALWSDGQAWHWRLPPGDFVPASVESLIEELIAAAVPTDEGQAVLSARAVLPGGLDAHLLPEVWRAVAGVEPAAFGRWQRHLIGAGLLRGTDFAHPLFAEVVAAHLGAREQPYARRALDALEANHPELAAPLLERAAADPERALRVLERAAAQAGGRGAHAQQATWLSSAVSLTPPDIRPQRALDAARALRDAGLVNEALTHAELAAATLPDAALLCAELLLSQGQVGAAEARLRALPGGFSEERWWALNLRHHLIRGHFAGVLGLWDAHPEWQADAPVSARRAAGSAYAFTWQIEPAEAIARELLARPNLSPDERLDARNLLGHVLNLRRAPERLDEERETIRLAREYNLPTHLGLALLNHAKTLKEQPGSAPDAALPLLTEAAELYGRLGHTLHYARCLLRLADQAMQAGAFEDAEEGLSQAHAIIRRNDSQHVLTESHLKHSRLYLTWRPPHGAPLALRHARQALELARASQDQKFLQLALRRVAQAEALGGHAQPALEAALEALTLAEAHSSEADLAFSWQAQGLALDAAGDHAEGAALLERAHDLFRTLEMRVEAEHAGLDADRITGNARRAWARRLWLLEHGHAGEASRALKFFPHLDDTRPHDTPALAATVCLNVLGPVTLERGGERVVYRARKRLELLAYLLEARLAGRAEVPLLELLDTFYPSDPETRARNTLKQQVFLLRGDLGAGSVLSTPGGYALGDVGSDAEAFLKGGPDHLWRGPYLDGLGEGWLPGVRDALTLALQGRAEARLTGDPPEAARLASILGRMEPYDAATLHLELRALHASGQARAAHTLYRDRRRTLKEVGEELPEEERAFLAL